MRALPYNLWAPRSSPGRGLYRLVALWRSLEVALQQSRSRCMRPRGSPAAMTQPGGKITTPSRNRVVVAHSGSNRCCIVESGWVISVHWIPTNIPILIPTSRISLPCARPYGSAVKTPHKPDCTTGSPHYPARSPYPARRKEKHGERHRSE